MNVSTQVRRPSFLFPFLSFVLEKIKTMHTAPSPPHHPPTSHLSPTHQPPTSTPQSHQSDAGHHAGGVRPGQARARPSHGPLPALRCVLAPYNVYISISHIYVHKEGVTHTLSPISPPKKKTPTSIPTHAHSILLTPSQGGRSWWRPRTSSSATAATWPWTCGRARRRGR